MLLMPRKMKYRKQQRGKMRGLAARGCNFAFGKFAIKSLACGLVSARELEAARRAMTRYIKRGGEVWIRVFPNKPITLTSPETPMGSGKGTVDHFAAVVRPGLILFEMDGVDAITAKAAMRLAQYKLSVKTKFISKED